MGCFLSSTKKTPPISQTKPNITTRSPPPTSPILEEEITVKEVLSETPSIPSKPIIPTHENINPQKVISPFPNNLEPKHHHLDDTVFKIAKIFNPKESPSGSGRVREVGPETRQRSPAKSRNSSPARGSGQLRNISPGRVRRNSGGLSRNEVIKKDSNGESSFRRTRSPIMCAENGGTRNSISRCPSARKTGKAPGRVRSELGDRRRRMEVGNVSYRENRENKRLLDSENESLENPLVSLECFIFL